METQEQLMSGVEATIRLRAKLFSDCSIIDCYSEISFQKACQALYAAGLKSILNGGIEVYYYGLNGVVCVKLYDEEESE